MRERWYDWNECGRLCFLIRITWICSNRLACDLMSPLELSRLTLIWWTWSLKSQRQYHIEIATTISCLLTITLFLLFLFLPTSDKTIGIARNMKSNSTHETNTEIIRKHRSTEKLVLLQKVPKNWYFHQAPEKGQLIPKLIPKNWYFPKFN